MTNAKTMHGKGIEFEQCKILINMEDVSLFTFNVAKELSTFSPSYLNLIIPLLILFKLTRTMI